MHNHSKLSQENWVFFLGFGCPCTLATFFFPTFVNLGLYALLFPLFVLLAVRSGPEMEREDLTSRACGKMPVFRQARWCSLQIIEFVFGEKYVSYKRGQQEKRKQQEKQERERGWNNDNARADNDGKETTKRCSTGSTNGKQRTRRTPLVQ